MKKYDFNKEFSSDKTIYELQFNLTFYKSRLELLTMELDFFIFLMTSNIYDTRIPNVFETFENFKKTINKIQKTKERLLKSINQQYNDVMLKLECDELSCDDYFIRRNSELEVEVVNFLMETAELKSKMIEYIKGIIK